MLKFTVVFATVSGSCTSSQYYDSVALACVSCATGLVQSSTSTGCDCPTNSIRATLYPLTCTACTTGYAPSADRSTCLPCDTTTMTATGGLCTCQSSLGVVVEVDLTGAAVTVSSAAGKKCVVCNSASVFPGSTSTVCSSCGLFKTRDATTNACSCSTVYTTANGSCIPTATYSAVITSSITNGADDTVFGGLVDTSSRYASLAATYSTIPLGSQTQVLSYSEASTFTTLLGNLGSTTLASSAVHATYFGSCGVTCVSSLNQQSCQCLANLCALSLYSSSSQACRLWSANSATIASVAPPLLTSTSVSSASLPLDIWAATFSASGAFIGYGDIGSSLEVCGVSDATPIWKTGAQVDTICRVSASSLASRSLIFYELHVLTSGGSRSVVPVTVLNNGKSGTRFYLVDAESSSSYVRYAAYLHIVRDSSDKLSVRVFYATVGVAGGGQAGAAIFRAEVGQPAGTNWYSAAVGLLAAATVIGVVGGLVSVVFTIKRMPAASGTGPRIFLHRWALQLRHFFNAVFGAYFVLLFILSCYWAIGYRGSGNGLLPTSADGGTDYAVSDGFIILLLTLGVICVIGDLIQASHIFVYFLDNEEPEAAAGHPSAPHSPMSANPRTFQPYQPGPTPYGMPMREPQPAAPVHEKPGGRISVWRSIFIANEYCERLTNTKTNSLYTWIIVVASLNLGSWELACRFYPSLASPYNPLLQASIPVLIWLAVVIGTVIWQRFLAIWGGSDLHDFVDICSLANISILVMDEPMHGWYVHGRAPSGKGDWSASELVQKLHEEESDLLLRRGLVPNDPRTCDLQTFEVLFPPKFPNDLFAHFDDIVATNNAISMRGGRVDSSDMAKMAEARKNLQLDVQSMLEVVVAEGIFRPKTVLERIGVSQAVDDRGKGVLLEDWTRLGWAEGLLHGSQKLGFPTGTEFRLIALELLIFLVTFRYSNLSVLAGGVALVVGQVIRMFREYIGHSLVAHTSGIDKRFFL
jgi:Meckelin (Transmembrane protein 67)